MSLRVKQCRTHASLWATANGCLRIAPEDTCHAASFKPSLRYASSSSRSGKEAGRQYETSDRSNRGHNKPDDQKIKQSSSSKNSPSLSKPFLQPMPSPESIRLRKPRVEWYNDPHILARRVTALLNSDEDEDYVLNLVERHTGSSNEVVYGALIGGLVKRKLYTKALEVFKEAKRKRLNISHRTFTALFKANAKLAALNPGDSDQVRSRFTDLLSLWSKIDSSSRNLFHVNAIMAACGDMVNAGGIEAGLELLALVSPSCKKARKDGVKLPKLLDIKDVPSAATFALPNDYDIVPDALTFTAALMLCAKQGGWDGFEAAKFIWENEVVSKSIKMDGQLANAMLLCCERSNTEESLQLGANLAQKYFLPRDDIKNGKSRPRPPELELAEQSCDVILKLACKLRDWDLGVSCINTSQRNELRMDLFATLNAVTILVKMDRYDRAWKLLDKKTARSPSDVARIALLRLKICSNAILDLKENSSKEALKSTEMEGSGAVTKDFTIWFDRAVASFDDQVIKHLQDTRFESLKSDLEVSLLSQYSRILKTSFNFKPSTSVSPDSPHFQAASVFSSIGSHAMTGIWKFFDIHFPKDTDASGTPRISDDAVAVAVKRRLEATSLMEMVAWDFISRMDKDFDSKNGKGEGVRGGVRQKIVSLRSNLVAFEQKWAFLKHLKPNGNALLEEQVDMAVEPSPTAISQPVKRLKDLEMSEEGFKVERRAPVKRSNSRRNAE